MQSRERGALEAQVLQALRRFSGPVSAGVVRETFAAPVPAYTTVCTVLDRLAAKGLVEREEVSPRRVRFSAVHSDDEHATALMMDALHGADDKHAALLRFAGNLDADDVAFLRDALGQQ